MRSVAKLTLSGGLLALLYPARQGHAV